MDQPITPERGHQRRVIWGSLWLGFALGGFFDGILLHQILQWHHLLSGVAPDGTVPDLRFQILADGLFHLMHYVVALLGLWLLWRARDALSRAPASQRIIPFLLIGFGVWHLIDGVLAHWVLQIHRIRMDVDTPLLWDLAWFIPFGVLPVALGAWMLRRVQGDSGGDGPHGRHVAASAALAAVIAGPIAALPPTDLRADGLALVVFRPGISLADIAVAADSVGGSLAWSDASMSVWMIAADPGADLSALYRSGALLVSVSAVAIGCLTWARL